MAGNILPPRDLQSKISRRARAFNNTFTLSHSQTLIYTILPPAMSSMRNAVQRRNHKERAQPLERQKWGLLEKHKDYSKRAADHNLKKRKLNTLRQKASERNEDEFYYGMMSSTSAGGVKRARRGEENAAGSGKSLGAEAVKLMKTQDEGYLRTVLQSTRHERERVEREVVTGGVGVSVVVPAASSRRVVFGEDGEDMPAQPVLSSDSDGDLDDMLSDEGDSDGEATETKLLSKEELAAKKRRRHALDVKRRQLEALRDREEQLSAALREVEAQRARMNGTAGGVNKNGVKFRAQRRST